VYAINLYQQIGGKVTCVSCWDQKSQKAYSFRKAAGINLSELAGISDHFGGIEPNKARDLGYEILPADAWIEQEVDILIPAAVENQVTSETAARIHQHVTLIAEGANGPTTPDADKMLAERKIRVIPDFLANAGGVTCSYFEQVQSNMNYYWEKDEVLSKLDLKMTSAYRAVSDLAEKRRVPMRDAAYLIAINRVADACRARGWI
jgi:glutamate dehydrogenase (NAD(P)+)